MFISLNSTCGAFVNLNDVRYFFIGFNKASRMDFTFTDGEDLTVFYEEECLFEKDKKRIKGFLASPEKETLINNKHKDVLKMSVEDMVDKYYGALTDMTGSVFSKTRLINLFKCASINTVDDLISLSHQEVKKIYNMGSNFFLYTLWIISKMGLHFRTD